jgi:hypothetical protein
LTKEVDSLEEAFKSVLRRHGVHPAGSTVKKIHSLMLSADVSTNPLLMHSVLNYSNPPKAIAAEERGNSAIKLQRTHRNNSFYNEESRR